MCDRLIESEASNSQRGCDGELHDPVVTQSETNWKHRTQGSEMQPQSDAVSLEIPWTVAGQS